MLSGDHTENHSYRELNFEKMTPRLQGAMGPSRPADIKLISLDFVNKGLTNQEKYVKIEAVTICNPSHRFVTIGGFL